MRERDRGARALFGAALGERAIGGVAVAEHDAAIVPEHRGGARGRAGAEQAVDDGIGSTERPHPPGLRPPRLHELPRRLVRPEHWRREHVGEERLVRRREMVTQREELVPERLRVDAEPRPRHLPHLAGEREVIEVLRHRHGDREVHRVPAAGHELRRPRRRDDAPAAFAAILLAAVPHDAKAPLNDVTNARTALQWTITATIRRLVERLEGGVRGTRSATILRLRRRPLLVERRQSVVLENPEERHG